MPDYDTGSQTYEDWVFLTLHRDKEWERSVTLGPLGFFRALLIYLSYVPVKVWNRPSQYDDSESPVSTWDKDKIVGGAG